MADTATPSAIAPALTAGEWAERDVENGTFRLHVDQFGILYGSSYDHAWQFLQRRRHGMAALCLHGQPFGFGYGDIDVLRAALGWFEADAQFYGASYADRDHLLDLIGRIGALLPPISSNEERHG